jgi:hypothetical protein
MPKKSPPGQSVDHWEKKGWTSVQLNPGVPVPVDYDPVSQRLQVKRQLFDSEGMQMTGHGNPKVKVEETETGGTITQPDPSVIETVTAVYRIVDEDDDDDEPEDVPPGDV